MSVYVVANPKGGVGKSTLSTNLAGYLARREADRANASPDDDRTPVVLADVDRQESGALWLSLRPPELPRIGLWTTDAEALGKLPKGARHAVIDTPAGLQGKRLDAVMKAADAIVVPLQASVFDIYATREFIVELRQRRRHAEVPIAVIGNRVREHTHAAEQLEQFLARLHEQIDVPVLGLLRDTHNYVHLAAHGSSLWDVAPGRVARDLEQWAPLCDWVDRH
ncbi:ParA family protein [Sphaerotilus mobilis]|uniref:Chromosome partitioning protein n=1 Tax=Sphaerotilus mobilis TaxID=47994 RepID=A0A4Q7LT33_9BURK|nr:ParA family protein [Sphaerotilus mobilis]RZS58095.1 chromosome partitioning protein [Sphaerotilus mobilis]